MLTAFWNLKIDLMVSFERWYLENVYEKKFKGELPRLLYILILFGQYNYQVVCIL